MVRMFFQCFFHRILSLISGEAWNHLSIPPKVGFNPGGIPQRETVDLNLGQSKYSCGTGPNGLEHRLSHFLDECPLGVMFKVATLGGSLYLRLLQFWAGFMPYPTKS